MIKFRTFIMGIYASLMLVVVSTSFAQTSNSTQSLIVDEDFAFNSTRPVIIELFIEPGTPAVSLMTIRAIDNLKMAKPLMYQSVVDSGASVSLNLELPAHIAELELSFKLPGTQLEMIIPAANSLYPHHVSW